MAYSKHSKYMPDEKLTVYGEQEEYSTTFAFKTSCQYLTLPFQYIISLSYAAFATFRKLLSVRYFFSVAYQEKLPV